MDSTLLIAAGLTAGLLLLPRIVARLRLSRAKHRSLRGHSKISRRVVRLIRQFSYAPEQWFSTDRAPAELASRRREALERLRADFQQQFAGSIALAAELEPGVSDVQFTNRYRVPFPYSAGLPRELRCNSIVTAATGNRLRDIDGHWRFDLSGSYGVNVFGYDFYQDCLSEGLDRVRELGVVLGPYHPVIVDNVRALRRISGLDEVSFHMSGTEAVMQAVRLARYHTGRSHLVRLCGAYHGWWDGVQPGVGNPRQVDDVYTLADLSERSLRVLDSRRDIACVLINPLQALHPNSDAPGDSTLVASDRCAQFDRPRYTAWLQQIREICTRRGIVLIFDEVFTGFRLGLRGAQEYYGVQADMVTYGKTLGGGLPVGVLCGRAALMKRFKPETPANISFARGTFNSHPQVMACMHAFLQRVETPETLALYAQADATWNARVAALNARLKAAGLPLQLVNLHSILTVLYTAPGRYNWMLQFYLRTAGLELSWIGTGRFIMPLTTSEDDWTEIGERFIAAARRMQEDGWWWTAPHLTNRWIKRQLTKDMLSAWRQPKTDRPPPDDAAAGVLAKDTVRG